MCSVAYVSFQSEYGKAGQGSSTFGSRFHQPIAVRVSRPPHASEDRPSRTGTGRSRAALGPVPIRAPLSPAVGGASVAAHRATSCQEDRVTRSFDSFSEREILALAISLEEEDERVYADYAERLRADFPASAAVLDGMRQEESVHRARLLERYRLRFGDHVPLIRRQDVRGFVARRSPWFVRSLGPEVIRRQAAAAEVESRRFYERAAARTTDPATRQLLDDLAQAERGHEERADALERELLTSGARKDEERAVRRLFVLQIVQPGLAASVGAGISMGFAEALSDDGSLTGRGHPWARGAIEGGMTAIGGIGHTLPFLISDFHVALIAATAVVLVELAAISWIRHRYMDTPPLTAAVQVGFGGALVFITGLLIGSS